MTKDTKTAKGRNRIWTQADQPQGQNRDRILEVEMPKKPSVRGTIVVCVCLCVCPCVSVCESACTHLCLHEGVHTESLGSGSRGPSTSSRVALRGLREGQAQLGQVWPGTAGLCSRSFGHHIHPQSSPGPTRGLVAGQEGVGASKHDPEGLSYRTSDPPAPPLAAQGQRTGRGTLNSLLAEGQAP